MPRASHPAPERRVLGALNSGSSLRREPRCSSKEIFALLPCLPSGDTPTFLTVTTTADAAPDPRYHGSWVALTRRLVARALISPRLAIDLVRAAWAFRGRDWWRHPPFLPLPDRTYLRWRMSTAYGDEAAVPPAGDVIRFARWRRTTMEL